MNKYVESSTAFFPIFFYFYFFFFFLISLPSSDICPPSGSPITSIVGWRMTMAATHNTTLGFRAGAFLRALLNWA
jgi:hypothetical protein